MIISIENTSSPGASFTDNTNNVILKTHEWIVEHNGEVLPFLDFRMKLQEDKKINDNNNRNIYPLMKNCGFVKYEKGSSLNVSYFFTNIGMAYILTLQSKKLLLSSGYSDQQKKDATQKLDDVKSELIYKGIKRLVAQDNVNYVEPFQDLIKFLLVFNKICKEEYAYLLYEKKRQYDILNAIDFAKENINLYRNGQLAFDVSVTIRNDINIRGKTNNENRTEGLSYLTSYGYFISLLQQANLVIKDGKYFLINHKKKSLIEAIGGF